MKKAKVYFTKEITSQKLIEMYKLLNKELKGKVAVKVHSGEKGNQNYLHPEFFAMLQHPLLHLALNHIFFGRI